LAQGTAPQTGNRLQVAGTVTAVDAQNKQVSIKTDQGESMTASATDRTLVLRIPPGETDPKKGAKITLGDVAAGDRVVAVSKQPIQAPKMDASALLILTKSDLAAIQQKDQEDWKKRGTTGMVTAVDAAAKTVTIKSGPRTLTVKATDKTDFHRYSPDSARFADSTPSNFAEIKPNDQLRVLGNKSEDGTAITAERVVFGTFRQIAATVISVDETTKEVKVTDLANKKGPVLTLRVNTDSTMKKLPEMQARMLARRYAPGAGGRGEGGGGGDRGGMMMGRGSGEGGGMARGGRGGDVGQMLDSLPPVPISELKKGDAVMVSTTAGSDPNRVTVVMLLAGVEPILTAAPTATVDLMGSWNLGGGGGGEGN
jgi:hypothetical protein